MQPGTNEEGGREPFAARAAEPIAGAAEPIAGRAAGVPFLAFPPPGGPRRSAPIVLAWHLLDAPRTERAFAAALPLAGLDAWRIYLGLPMTGSRSPAGGQEEVMRLGAEDAVMNLYGPITFGAAEELGPAFAVLRERLALESDRVGVMGGSQGAAVAQLVMAEARVSARAAVLVSPVVQLRRTVEAVGRRLELPYTWSDESNAVADRLDFVARAPEIAWPPTLIVVGERDDRAFHESASDLRATLGDRAELVTLAGMPHALADEPGTDPAPQTAHAAQVDARAVEWFRRYL
jgi:dienelactone hydrolase